MKAVQVCDYDTSWPRRYEREAGHVRAALTPLTVEVQHIGSTSVPGLAAKPTIDILVGARSLDINPEAMNAMTRLGYEHRGEMGVPGRQYFRKGGSYPRDFNVHVVAHRSELWDDYLAFRDYLRARPDVAQTYEALKRKLAATPNGTDVTSYAEGKAAFIADALQRARQWRTTSRAKA